VAVRCVLGVTIGGGKILPGFAPTAAAGVGILPWIGVLVGPGVDVLVGVGVGVGVLVAVGVGVGVLVEVGVGVGVLVEPAVGETVEVALDVPVAMLEPVLDRL